VLVLVLVLVLMVVLVLVLVLVLMVVLVLVLVLVLCCVCAVLRLKSCPDAVSVCFVLYIQLVRHSSGCGFYWTESECELYIDSTCAGFCYYGFSTAKTALTSNILLPPLLLQLLLTLLYYYVSVSVLFSMFVRLPIRLPCFLIRNR